MSTSVGAKLFPKSCETALSEYGSSFLSYLARERIFLKTAKNTTAPASIAIGGPTESGIPYDISPLKTFAPINTVRKNEHPAATAALKAEIITARVLAEKSSNGFTLLVR
jgi:hypothetical protein